MLEQRRTLIESLPPEERREFRGKMHEMTAEERQQMVR